MGYKSGYVSLVGRANAGKSTLINALIGEKVAIVSPKPQTTRNNIIGILTKQNYQFVFVDTPGIHISKNALDKYMMKNVRSAIGGSDIIVYLIDGSKKLTNEELEYIQNLVEKDNPVIVAITKVDILNYEKVYPMLAKLGQIKGIKEIIPLSSLQKRNLDVLEKAILKLLPESETKNFLYAEDEFTDKSVRFLVAEIVREQALYLYDEEIPHGLAIQVVKFDEQEHIVNVDIDIVCERDSHKAILIGKQGHKLRELGQRARQGMQELLNQKVMLKLFVKTKKNWRDSQNYLNDFGYNDKLED
ncbi:MAG: GTPase Era [Clostridiales bacterium]|nr:GTPase Era [Clostridiales bacterium]